MRDSDQNLRIVLTGPLVNKDRFFRASVIDAGNIIVASKDAPTAEKALDNLLKDHPEYLDLQVVDETHREIKPSGRYEGLRPS